MKTKEQSGDYKIETIPQDVFSKKKETGHTVGRQPKYPLYSLKNNTGFFVKGVSIAKISPLIHYYATKVDRVGQYHGKTIEKGGEKGVFVFRTGRSQKKSKELAAAN